jgi:hypothetical protein
MFIFFGRYNIRTKKIKKSEFMCDQCMGSTYEISVYQGCYHLFLIPFFPTGIKQIKAKCPNCSRYVENLIRPGDTSMRKTPFYMYSGIILILCSFLFVILMGIISHN